MSRELFVAEPVTTYSGLPPMVVDCSLLAAILFNEPTRDEALKVLSGKALHAPHLIDDEIVSVAVKKSEAKALVVVEKGLDDYRKLRLTRHYVDRHAQYELALSEKLSAYHAAYLQLAVTLNAPLATYDPVLGAAAQRVL